MSRRLASVNQMHCEIAGASPAQTKHGQMRMLEEKHEEVFARGFMLSSALLLYFPGDSTTHCRRYQRSTNARCKQAVRWMKTLNHAAPCVLQNVDARCFCRFHFCLACMMATKGPVEGQF